MKRFTETSKWHDPWFWRLSPSAKLLWYYLTEHCDCTGLIDFDFDLASVGIGAKITEKHLAELGNRVQRTEEGKLFIPRFIPFQYGTLSEGCPAHKPVLKLVTERNLSRNGKGYQYPNATLALPMPMGSERVQDKEKDKEKSTEGEVQEGIKPEQIYQAYPRHEDKEDALKAISKRITEGKDPSWLLLRVQTYARLTTWKERRYIPLPATWFNKGRFNDDDSAWHDPSKPPPPKPPSRTAELISQALYGS